MTQPEVIAVIENRFIKISTSLHAILRNSAIADIRRFRVEIKRLNAFLHMVQSEWKDADELKFSKRLKKFYTAIGIIRNLQLQQVRIKKIVAATGDKLPSEYLRTLDGYANAEMVAAKNLMKIGKSIGERKKHIISFLREKVCKIKTKRFLISESKLLDKQLMLRLYDDKSLHLIRKILKNILYTQPYIKKEIGTILPSWLSDQARLKLLDNLLGNFRDACTGLNFLQFDFKDNIIEKERIVLKNIEKEWLGEKESVKQEIMNQLKQFQLHLNPIKPDRNKMCLN
jgi:hypothetical protein